jgi:hypothetical protein
MDMSPDIPDPDPAIGEASKGALDLANRQFDSQQALLAEYSPLFKDQIEFSLAQQGKNAQRSDQSWNDYQTTWRPLEQKFASTALNYDTEARRDKAAADAMSGVTSTFDQARQGLTESLGAQRIGASSGKGLALRNAMGIQEARAKAGAGAAARRSVETTGLNLLGSASNFGRNMPNTGLSAGAAGMQAGNNATSQVGGLSSLTGAGYGQALQGYGVGINGLTGLYQAQAQASGQQNGMFGDLLGAGMMGYGMYKSTKKAKNPGKPVDGKRALQGLSDLNVEDWSYKEGQGDGGSHVGPYAEDVRREFGDGVAPGGKAIRIDSPDQESMSDINGKAIAELAKQLQAINAEIKSLESA